MCGIAGILNFNNEPVEYDVLKSISDAQLHRGPDQEGIKLFDVAGIAHRRLSIIDLANGKQPLCNEDKTIWVIYNGEIYNHKEIRENLISRGHIFKTSCDTEILVHLYEEEGCDFLNKLNGMFAFAIYDSRKRRFILARDRAGQKPLYYFKSRRCFVFASELHALRMHPDMPCELDLQSLHHYFSLQYIPAPNTVYKKVYKLNPASILEISVDAPEPVVSKYWHLRYFPKRNIGYNNAKEQLKELLRDSVRKRLMSDVPLGAFLSGGIDSSIITGVMSDLCGEKIKTFTIGFYEDRYDERRFAKASAERFGTEHHEKIVKPNDFSVVETLIKHYGEPYSDASMLPTYQLCKFAREFAVVVLSGDAADELFGGYYRYLVMRISMLTDFFPTKLRKVLFNSFTGFFSPKGEDERSVARMLSRFLGSISVPIEKRYLTIINRFSEDMKYAVYGKQFTEKYISTYDLFYSYFKNCNADSMTEKIMELDFHTYLPGDILPKTDITSMAVSLELRNPFLDHRIIEFAASLPLDYKLTSVSRKRILKDAFSDTVPDVVLSRSKKGFGVPMASWFRKEWNSILKDYLPDGRSVKEGFFNGKSISEMIHKHEIGEADYSYSLWALLVFELWLRSEKK